MNRWVAWRRATNAPETERTSLGTIEATNGYAALKKAMGLYERIPGTELGVTPFPATLSELEARLRQGEFLRIDERGDSHAIWYQPEDDRFYVRQGVAMLSSDQIETAVLTLLAGVGYFLPPMRRPTE